MDKVCFLCNSRNDLSIEHVFPKWLLNRYSLWNQSFTLKNGTTIQYKNIKVPCCKECNNNYLSIIEKKVQQWVEHDIKIDDSVIFAWTLKIMLGVHYKETTLKDNIKNANSESIVDLVKFNERTSLRHMLLCVRDKVRFLDFKPYSIYLHSISNASDNDFFYFDEPYHMFFSLQMGKKAVNCTFQDDGFVKRMIEKANPNKDFLNIDKYNYAEIAALMFDLKRRLKELPNYLVSFNGKIAVYARQTDLEPELESAFNIYIPKNYFEILQKYFGHYFNDLCQNDSNGTPVVNYVFQTVIV